MMLGRAVLLLVLVVVSSLLVFAQTAQSSVQPTTALFSSIAGIVATRDGSPVPDARVEAYNPSTGLVIASAYSRQNGSFLMEDVPLGSYDLHARVGYLETSTTVLLRSAGNAAAKVVKLFLPQDWMRRRSSESATVSVTQLRRKGDLGKRLGNIQQALHDNKNDEAGKYIAEAVRKYPDNAEVLTFSGLLKMRRADHAGALDDLDRAAKADPHCARTFLALGALFNRMQRYDDAERALDRAITLDPSSWQAYYELGQTKFATDDSARAAELADRALALQPEDFPPVHLLRAQALLKLNNLREAATELEAYVDRETAKEPVERAQQVLMRVRSQVHASLAQAGAQ